MSPSVNVRLTDKSKLLLVNLGRCLLILGCAIPSVLPCLSLQAESPAKSKTPADSATYNLCSEARIICVSKSVVNSLVNNPFRIDVQANSADDIQILWEIRDNTGQLLESSSTYDYTDQPTEDFTPGRTLHIQAFIFRPAKSTRGTLTLTPSRYTIRDGGVNLQRITIPVRLTTAKSTVTVLMPEKPEELKSTVNDWMDGADHKKFDPRVKLVPQQVEIMQFDRAAIIGATVEAVLRSWPGQGQWHVAHWQQSGTTAHVKLITDGWTGVTYYATAVCYLIWKSVVHLPGIKDVVFDREIKYGTP